MHHEAGEKWEEIGDLTRAFLDYCETSDQEAIMRVLKKLTARSPIGKSWYYEVAGTALKDQKLLKEAAKEAMQNKQFETALRLYRKTEDDYEYQKTIEKAKRYAALLFEEGEPRTALHVAKIVGDPSFLDSLERQVGNLENIIKDKSKTDK